ncbi:MAG: four helix bundle protein [Akkermansia sp.]
MAKSIVKEKSFCFAVRVVNLYKYLCEDKKEYVLSKQLLRCGTSIGANVAEAIGGISRKDFSAKMFIAYKESLETEYWLDLLKACLYLTEAEHQSMRSDCSELARMLTSITKHSR